LLELRAADNRVRSLATREVPAVQAALDAEATLIRLQRDLQGVLLMDNETANSSMRETLAADDKQFTEAAAKLSGLLSLPEEKANLATLNQAYADWAPMRARVLELALTDQIVAARQIVFGSASTQAITAINTAIDNLVRLVVDHTTQVSRESRSG